MCIRPRPSSQPHIGRSPCDTLNACYRYSVWYNTCHLRIYVHYLSLVWYIYIHTYLHKLVNTCLMNTQYDVHVCISYHMIQRSHLQRYLSFSILWRTCIFSWHSILSFTRTRSVRPSLHTADSWSGHDCLLNKTERLQVQVSNWPTSTCPPSPTIQSQWLSSGAPRWGGGQPRSVSICKFVAWVSGQHRRDNETGNDHGLEDGNNDGNDDDDGGVVMN